MLLQMAITEEEDKVYVCGSVCVWGCIKARERARESK